MRDPIHSSISSNNSKNKSLRDFINIFNGAKWQGNLRNSNRVVSRCSHEEPFPAILSTVHVSFSWEENHPKICRCKLVNPICNPFHFSFPLSFSLSLFLSLSLIFSLYLRTFNPRFHPLSLVPRRNMHERSRQFSRHLVVPVLSELRYGSLDGTCCKPSHARNHNSCF